MLIWDTHVMNLGPVVPVHADGRLRAVAVVVERIEHHREAGPRAGPAKHLPRPDRLRRDPERQTVRTVAKLALIALPFFPSAFPPCCASI